ncbi:hypothetical protein ACHAXT_005110 [Thalassiosira profunda]
MARGRRTRGRAAEEEGEGGDGDKADESMEADNQDEAAAEAAETTPAPSRRAAPAASATNQTGAPAEDESVLRILLSTDNHLGYLERDAIRGGDSFAAFEEVLSVARHHKADMVLLAGDLFHDNKPSRKTLHTTMEILRRYCMGSDSVGFQIVSDQKECLRSTISGRANYEDEFYSVDLPVFTIHGNHDDPTRDGGPELLSAVDLLSVSNLVNYFGRQDEVDNVRVSPVLLQKGETKVALYGMGSMRDERLNRMWQGKKVKFLRPDSNQDEDEADYGEDKWFNIFALHQNRDLGRGSKNCVHESMIPEWMDLVVWGHEHECLIDPSESLVGTFRITQPGSSVATSLTAGESRRKNVGLLEIKGSNFRLTPIPLTSVRSFAVGDVSLGERAREQGGVLDVEDPKVEERMSEVLCEEVEALIQRARDDAEHLRQDAEDQAQRTRALEDELKVEHTGFTTLNNQRFGSQFVGQVGNPSDILLFHKRRQAESAKGGKGSKKKRGAAGLDEPIEPEDLAEVNIGDLVSENLVKSDKKLELLDEKSMDEALDQFVEKKNTKAIEETALSVLKQSQKILWRRNKEAGDEDDGVVDNPTQIRSAQNTRWRKEDEAEEKRKKRASKGEENGDAKKSSRKASAKDDDSVESEEEEERPAKKKAWDHDQKEGRAQASQEEKRAPAKKAAASSKKRRAKDDSDSDIEFMGTQSEAAASAKPARSGRRAAAKKPKYTDDYSDDDVEVIDDDSDVVEETPMPTSGRGKKAARSTGTGKARAPSQTQSTLTSFTSSRKPAASSRRRGKQTSYEESDSEDYEPSTEGGGAWGTASQSAKGRGRR